LAPVPGHEVDQLALEEIDRDVVDERELLQYERLEDWVGRRLFAWIVRPVVHNERTHSPGVLGPAVACDKSGRLSIHDISEGRIDDSAYGHVRERLSSNDIQRVSILICSGGPPCGFELHPNFDGRAVAQLSQGVGLHRGETGLTEVNRAQDR
jgi:hypothetical protein